MIKNFPEITKETSLPQAFDIIATFAEINNLEVKFRTERIGSELVLRVKCENKLVEFIPIRTSLDVEFVNMLLDLHDNCEHKRVLIKMKEEENADNI